MVDFLEEQTVLFSKNPEEKQKKNMMTANDFTAPNIAKESNDLLHSRETFREVKYTASCSRRLLILDLFL